MAATAPLVAAVCDATEGEGDGSVTARDVMSEQLLPTPPNRHQLDQWHWEAIQNQRDH